MHGVGSCVKGMVHALLWTCRKVSPYIGSTHLAEKRKQHPRISRKHQTW